MNRVWYGGVLMFGLLFALAACGQSYTDQTSINSVSGQIYVSSVMEDSPIFRNPNLRGDTNLVRLKPPFLAIAAERFKLSLWQQLGIKANESWSGKIHLLVRPARSANETVIIASTPFLNHWNYEVELPDTLKKMRYARALSGVFLMELANRNARPRGHTAELPPWLVDGLARQVISIEGDKILLTTPLKLDGNVLSGRLNEIERNFDPLANARLVLGSVPVLTFDQLSWPSGAQMDGDDGGAYLASVQLFVSELLKLKNGPEKLRTMLAELPSYMNWQTAFFSAFDDDFQRPVDVEKWWALQIVNFAAFAPGPHFTTDISRTRLEGLLAVPVEFRSDSNAMPVHADISLQAALKNLTAAQRDVVLRNKIRDIALVELRLAQPFSDLADGYRNALADFIGEMKKPAPVSVSQPKGTTKHAAPMNHKVSLDETLKKLDALDHLRRELEAKIFLPLPGNPPAKSH